jgi:hypothetical protein
MDFSSGFKLENNEDIKQNSIGRVLGYQRGNQNPHIEDEQTTHRPKEKYKRTNKFYNI